MTNLNLDKERSLNEPKNSATEEKPNSTDDKADTAKYLIFSKKKKKRIN